MSSSTVPSTAERSSRLPSAVEENAAEAPRSQPTPWVLSLLLWAGVAITAVSLLALVVMLFLYFQDQDPAPVLSWLGLFGLPIGFGLLMVHVITSAILRRRR